MRSTWESLSGEGYVLEDLGRPAIFLLPTKKLQIPFKKTTIGKDLHRFIIEHFGAYTASTIPSFGFWKSAERATISSDECQEYEVSFLGKERMLALLKKLAEIAAAMEEECIYVKAGQYSCLVYPAQKESSK